MGMGSTGSYLVVEPIVWLRIFQFLAFLPLCPIVNRVPLVHRHKSGSKGFRRFPQFKNLAVTCQQVTTSSCGCFRTTEGFCCVIILIFTHPLLFNSLFLKLSLILLEVDEVLSSPVNWSCSMRYSCETWANLRRSSVSR